MVNRMHEAVDLEACSLVGGRNYCGGEERKYRTLFLIFKTITERYAHTQNTHTHKTVEAFEYKLKRCAARERMRLRCGCVLECACVCRRTFI